MKRHGIPALVALAVLAPVRTAAPAPAAVSRPEPSIRVCLAEAVEQVRIECTGDVVLRAEDAHYLVPCEPGPLTVQFVDGTLLLRQGGRTLCRSDRGITLESAAAATRYQVNGLRLTGALFFLRVGERLTVVSEMPLEEYLRGVVPGEIGRHAPEAAAAVEAQAIAARTYAYKRLGRYPEAGFDVYADVTDQVFQGFGAADSSADAAIRATRGLILWSGDEPLEAYYSSTCGGHTSRIEAVWDKPAAAALRGGRDAPADGGSYCAQAPHFRWCEAWSGAGLERTLQETLPRELRWPPGTAIGALQDLRVLRRDETGRVGELQITTTLGRYLVRGDRIRWVLRPGNRAILRSTLFDLQLERLDGKILRVIVRGGGNGHGVGLCQTGALEMARRGIPAADILSHYYRGVELLHAY